MKLIASPVPGAMTPSLLPSGYSSVSPAASALGLSKNPLRMMGFALPACVQGLGLRLGLGLVGGLALALTLP
jgi:hypothetical protein